MSRGNILKMVFCDLILTWRDIWKSWGNRAIKQEMTAGVQAKVMRSDELSAVRTGKGVERGEQCKP